MNHRAGGVFVSGQTEYENGYIVSMVLLPDRHMLTAFCRRHYIRRLSVFGSAARGELLPSSDVDFLVEYDPSHRPGIVELQEIEDELSALCHGRPVDLVNPRYLNPRLRERILGEAVVQYEG